MNADYVAAGAGSAGALIASGNTNAASIMIGEKGAEHVRAGQRA